MPTEVLEFRRGDGVSSVSFRFDLSEGYQRQTVARPDQIYTSVQVKGGKISVFRDVADELAGPFSSCAEWLTSWGGSDGEHLVHTHGGSRLPGELFFAYQGILDVDGHSFRLRFGRGEHGALRPWHVASGALQADDDNRGGLLITDEGGLPVSTAKQAFELRQDGTHAFVVRAKK